MPLREACWPILTHLTSSESGVEMLCHLRARTWLAVKATVRGRTRVPYFLTASRYMLYKPTSAVFRASSSLIFCPVSWKRFVRKSGGDFVGL
jgi:hypothetical protein